MPSIYSTYLTPLLLLVPLFATTALSIGIAEVVNTCTGDIFVRPRWIDGVGSLSTIPPGNSYSEAFRGGEGIAIQLDTSPDMDDPLHFDYTLKSDGLVWYDLGGESGNPFRDVPITLGAPGCHTIGQSEVIYSPNDGGNEWTCSDGSQLTLRTCG